MTEAEWLECTDPMPMLEFVRGKASERKLRLFAVACCRRITHLLSDERSRQAVEVGERYADGLVTDDVEHVLSDAARSKGVEAEEEIQCRLLRDVFGPVPFRSVTLDRAVLLWNGDTILKMAQTIYDGRALDGLPMLADALDDAGCTNPDILAHCRQPGEHVRGCWVVDLILGKE